MSLFFLLLLVLSFCPPSFSVSYNFQVDNTNDPTFSLYIAFFNAKNAQPSASSLDEFHFQLVPSTTPYSIMTSDYANGFIFDTVSGVFSLLFSLKTLLP